MRKAQVLRAEDQHLTDDYVMGRPFGLLVRTRDRKIIEAIYCLDAEELLINYLYHRMAKPLQMYDTFRLLPRPDPARGGIFHAWTKITMQALIALSKGTDDVV